MFQLIYYPNEIGEVGSATKMNLVLQLMMGVAVAGVAEGMALADRAGLQQRDVLEIFELTPLSSPLLLEKGKGNSYLIYIMCEFKELRNGCVVHLS